MVPDQAGMVIDLMLFMEQHTTPRFGEAWWWGNLEGQNDDEIEFIILDDRAAQIYLYLDQIILYQRKCSLTFTFQSIQ